MKRLLFWIIDCWRLVMDNRFNPLRHIPDPSIQAYFTLVLFTMWSIFFGFVGTYYLGWYGYDTVTSIIVHLGVIIPLIFTNIVFQEAERDGRRWFVQHREEQLKKKLFPRKDNVIKWDMDNEA